VAAPERLLSVQGLSVEFRTARGTIAAVRDLSFDVRCGETVAIVGESGSGKSVTALSVLRLVEREGGTITSGRIRFRHKSGVETDLRQLPERALQHVRGDEISMIFQEPMTSLNPLLTIGAQIAEVLVQHHDCNARDALQRALDMLKVVRMPDPERRLTQYPHELSGGMRQRVMIAMALLCRPSLLIADEPTTALDVTIQAQILELIRTLQEEFGMAVLFITHDMGIVAEFADRVVVMHQGRKVEENEVRRLFAAPADTYTQRLLAAVPRLGRETIGHGLPEGGRPPVLEVANLTKRFPVRRGLLKRTVGYVHAVEDVSFALRAGETIGLVGESGCGKSTTGRTLMKLTEPTAGSIRIAGEDVTGLSRAAMRARRRHIQMIFQDPYASLNPRLSALAAVTEPLEIHERLSRGERRERAAALLTRVGLSPDHLDRYPHQFSGGQRQRLAIARALALGPRVIVADEPVSALDVSVQAQVIELMKELQRVLGVAYIFISHDMAVVEKMSHRVAVMYLGEIVEMGPATAVLHDPRHAYTKRLLASVPVADPAVRRPRLPLDASEVPSPIRPLGWQAPRRPLAEVAPGHFVRAA
jgi:ABC-type microcin C transport system duplicated ATPase subunit YejF